MSRTWYVRRLVTEPGRRALERDELAALLRDHVLGEEQVHAGLSAHACAQVKIKRRYLEIQDEVRPGNVDPDLARRSLGKRTLSRLLRDELPPDELVLVCRGGSTLIEHFLPYCGVCRERVSVAPHPASGLLLAHTLLAKGTSDRVAMVCLDAGGTEAWARLRRAPSSVAALIAATMLSDCGAGVLLSRRPGPEPRLAYSEMLPAPPPAQAARRTATAGRDATELHDSLIADIGAWAEETTLPTLVLPGGSVLLDVLARRHPALESTVSLSREVLEDNGQLGLCAGLWLLDRALRERVPLDPAFRLVTAGPDLSTHALMLEGVHSPCPCPR